MKRSHTGRRILIVLGCVALCLFPVIAIFLISQTTPATTSNGTPAAPGTGVPVVVTSTSVATQGQFTGDNVKLVTLPQASLPSDASGYYSATDALTKLPHYAVVSLLPNTIVLSTMVSTTTQAAQGAAILGPLVTIASGDIAMSIPFDEADGAGGYLQPGDRIDIGVDTSGGVNVTYAFMDVLVLKVGGLSQQAPGTPPNLLLVEMSRNDAKQMMSLIDTKTSPPAVIRYLLRSRLDYSTPSPR